MIQGSIVALVTPMQTDGAIDFARLRALVDWHIEQGTDAIVSVGTTGESATLSVREHLEVVTATVEQAAGRLPIIAGTGANSTSEAIELTRSAAQAGADACLLVTPYYNKPTQEGLFQHFSAIAAAVDIPQIIYNVPGRTSLDMLPETSIRLSSVANIVGIKEAYGTVERIMALVESCPADFAVYTGDDATACESILVGAKGDISVTANIAPALMHEMCAAALAGDRSQAEQIDRKLSLLHQNLFLESNPIPVKWALAESGQISAGIRLPLTPLAAQHHEAVRQAVQAAQ